MVSQSRVVWAFVKSLRAYSRKLGRVSDCAADRFFSSYLRYEDSIDRLLQLQPQTNYVFGSIREIEVIVSVVIVFSLPEEGPDEVHGEWQPGESDPDSEAEVDDPSLDEELTSSTVQEMEEPLLSGVRSMMPDVASAISRLLIEVLFSIPSSVLHLWNSKTFPVSESHVFHVSKLVMLKSSSFDVHGLLLSIKYKLLIAKGRVIK